MAIGQWIQATRDAAGMTQEDLGRLLGLKRSLVSRYETGDRAVSSKVLSELEKILLKRAPRAASPLQSESPLSFEKRSKLATEFDCAPLARLECMRRFSEIVRNATSVHKLHLVFLLFEDFLRNCSERLEISAAGSNSVSMRLLLHREWQTDSWIKLEELDSRIAKIHLDLGKSLPAGKRAALMAKKKTLQEKRAKLFEALEGKIDDSTLRQFAKGRRTIPLPSGQFMPIRGQVNLDQVFSEVSLNYLDQYWNDLFDRFEDADGQDAEDEFDSDVDYISRIPLDVSAHGSKAVECCVPSEVNLQGNISISMKVVQLEYSFGAEPTFLSRHFRTVEPTPGTGDFRFKVLFGDRKYRYVQLKLTDKRNRRILSPVYFLHPSGRCFPVPDSSGTPEEVLERCWEEFDRRDKQAPQNTVSKTVSKGASRSRKKPAQALEK